MNPGRFFMPNYIGNMRIPMSSQMMSPMLRMANTASRGTGLLSKITGGIRSVNWSGLLNNANKTLNFVNQAIPLVRQAGPMVNNMKSMLRIAKAFGSETTNDQIKRSNTLSQTNINNSNNNNVINNNNSNIAKELSDDNSPNFFV
jgi:hypothetical protein